MAEKFHLRDIVEVDWVDSAFNRGWESVRSKRSGVGIARCRSAGYLLSSDKKTVRIVSSQAKEEADGSCADAISIPREAVKRIRRIGRTQQTGKRGK